MRHICSSSTDLVELLGREEEAADGVHFHYGPISQAMKNNEELVLENSCLLSKPTLAKIAALIGNLFLVETEENIHPGKKFHLVLR